MAAEAMTMMKLSPEDRGRLVALLVARGTRLPVAFSPAIPEDGE
jgi:hypothetical protein